MDIGSKIKKSRIDAKLTQEQAAEALGVGVVGALLSYCSNLTPPTVESFTADESGFVAMLKAIVAD